MRIDIATSTRRRRRRSALTASVAALCLALAACGSDGEPPDVSLPSSVSLPDRTTTVPTETPSTETPTTRTPITETPITETPTTETPATESPTTTAAALGAEEASSDDATPWWPWVLGGALLLGLIAFLVMRGSGGEASWQEQVVEAFDTATRLATDLAAVSPEGAAMVAGQDAQQLAALAASLQSLGAKSPDDAQRAAIASVHDQVQVLHGVLDGIAMAAGPASPAATDHLKEQATALHGVTALARAQVVTG